MAIEVRRVLANDPIAAKGLTGALKNLAQCSLAGLGALPAPPQINAANTAWLRCPNNPANGANSTAGEQALRLDVSKKGVAVRNRAGDHTDNVSVKVLTDGFKKWLILTPPPSYSAFTR